MLAADDTLAARRPAADRTLGISREIDALELLLDGALLADAARARRGMWATSHR